MLTVSDLSKTFNLQTLFEKINFSVNPGERVGLIGPNGSGKTTLLRIIAGKENAASGHVHHPNNFCIGYLPQVFEIEGDLAIREVIGRAVGDIETLQDDLAAAARELAKEPQNTHLADRYDSLLRRIQAADQAGAETILLNLGLSDIGSETPVSILSGGQRTRLALALVLLGNPDMLLLDEPTNHLDIEMLEWLENWLVGTSCGALIVSHDRVFLDNTITRILALDPDQQSIRSYDGNYSDYMAQRRTEVEKHWAQYNDQQLEVRRMKADIARAKSQAAYTERQSSSIRIGGPEMKIKGFKDYQRSIAKKVAKKAKSREKRLDQYLGSDERVVRPKKERNLYFEFRKTPHLGRSVVQLEELSVGYDASYPLLTDLNLQVRAGQRIALTGPNGCGKTSLLKTIMGDIPALAGKVLIGSSVHLGSMSQDLSNLDLDKNPVETLMHTFPNQTEARRFLAAYMLVEDEVLKPVRLLSFGQRARLELALLIVNGCNVLLLDEPINHLDIPSRSQFEEALDAFEGAVLAVVHDRYFIEHFADEVWLVNNGKILMK